MKSLNDMFSEEDKKKPHLAKEGEGADDKMYVKLMADYKRARRGDPKEANKILEKAHKLAVEGEVSKKAMMAGAYI